MDSRFEVKGWCPGARRPMASGDGLLVRLRLSGGHLDFATARAIARLAQRYGSGDMDVSARANLQMRGVSEENWPHLIAELEALRLVDDDAELEAVRNIAINPLSGFDPASCDVWPHLHALEEALKTNHDLHDLPGKFGFSLCGGGALPLLTHADIGFRLFSDKAVMMCGEQAIGACGTDEVIAKAVDAARFFLGQKARRMHECVAQLGATVVAAEMKLAKADADAPVHRAAVIGRGAHHTGIGLAFGRLAGDQLLALADFSEQAGAEALRITPWRALAIVGQKVDQALLLSAAKTTGFITEPDDSLRHVVACAGAPFCPQAKADGRALAARLAPLVPAALAPLHVSSCAKGCAHHAPAPLTITATDAGFDVIEKGFARSMPALHSLNAEQLAPALKVRYLAMMRAGQ